MSEKSKIAIVVSIIVVLLIVVIAKQGIGTAPVVENSQPEQEVIAQTPVDENSPGDEQPVVLEGLPKMIELGRESCKPCKLMKPIIADLQKNYTDSIIVEFIHTDKYPEQAKKYKIKLIPTQVFFDPSGKELFRHTGFFPKEEILAEWKKLGYDIEPDES